MFKFKIVGNICAKRFTYFKTHIRCSDLLYILCKIHQLVFRISKGCNSIQYRNCLQMCRRIFVLLQLILNFATQTFTFCAKLCKMQYLNAFYAHKILYKIKVWRKGNQITICRSLVLQLEVEAKEVEEDKDSHEQADKTCNNGYCI